MRSDLHLVECGRVSEGGRTLFRFRLMEGSVVHVDGWPVRVRGDVEIETASPLIDRLEDAERAAAPAPVVSEAPAESPQPAPPTP